MRRRGRFWRPRSSKIENCATTAVAIVVVCNVGATALIPEYRNKNLVVIVSVGKKVNEKRTAEHIYGNYTYDLLWSVCYRCL